MNHTSVNALVGKTICHIEGDKVGSEMIRFMCTDGSIFKMWHIQDCCESVDLNEVIGDTSDLIGVPILSAEEATSVQKPVESMTEYEKVLAVTDALDGVEVKEDGLWTFYRFQTINGSVTLRWYGQSEYYSVAVSFAQITEGDDE